MVIRPDNNSQSGRDATSPAAAALGMQTSQASSNRFKHFAEIQWKNKVVIR